MKNMPWQDIYSIPKWNRIIDYFKKGEMTTSGPSAKRSLGFFKINVKLPPDIMALDQNVRNYHRIPKQDIKTLGVRAGALREIALEAQRYQAKHAIAPKPHVDPKRRGNRQKWESNMDYAIAKLARKAARKAAYIQKLNSLYGAGHPGFRGVRELLKYIVEESKAPEDINLVGMKRGLIMEKIDPWHRDFELNFASTSCTPSANQDKLYGMAFAQWIESQRNSGMPFFVWAEGHYMCTEAMADSEYQNSSGGSMNLPDLIAEKGHIVYKKSDDELTAGILMLWTDAGKLFAYNHVDTIGFIYQLYDTNTTHRCVDESGYQKNIGDITSGLKLKAGPKNAYVWTRDKSVFAAAHKVGHLHHSSFVSGEAVRCAGMIGVKDGKITWVDNDSGHYQPTTQHLRNFVNYLAENHVFAPGALVYDESTKKSAPWADFKSNKPPRPSKDNRAARPRGRFTPAGQGQVAKFVCASCGKKHMTRGFCSCSTRGPIIAIQGRTTANA